MDLSKKALPETIEVLGKVYFINTDFQFFISFLNMLKSNHNLNDFDFMYKTKIPLDKQKGFDALVAFALPKKELPRMTEEPTSETLWDYILDSELIYAAFYQQYKIDLFEDGLHLHWYKFLSLFNGLKDTKMNDVISFRSYVPGMNDSKEYKKNMLKKKEAWRIEKQLSDEEQKVVDEFDALLKK